MDEQRLQLKHSFFFWVNCPFEHLTSLPPLAGIKFVLLLEQPSTSLSGLRPNQQWPRLRCSAPTTPSAPRSDALLCWAQHQEKSAPPNTGPPPCFDAVAGRAGYLARRSLVLSSLPPGLSLLQDVFVELGSLLFTHWVGWPPRVAAGC